MKLWIAFAFALLSPLAHAACACQCVNGEVRPICQSAMDMPPICPLRMCPMTPLSLPPLAPMQLPPLGTQNCRNVQVWDGARYVWRVVCS